MEIKQMKIICHLLPVNKSFKTPTRLRRLQRLQVRPIYLIRTSADLLSSHLKRAEAISDLKSISEFVRLNVIMTN